VSRATGRAGGKAILFGEHTVVYGGAAVATPVTGLHVEVEVAPGSGWDLPDQAATRSRRLDRARDVILAEIGWPGLPPMIRVRGTLPPACGLGSSAALSIALSRALLDAAGRPADDDVVRELANASETVFHGNASGVDVATVLAGKPILFRRGEPATPVSVGDRIDLWLVDTQVRSSTSEVVADVASLRRSEPERFREARERIARSVDDGIGALTTGSTEELAAAMSLAMGGLRAIRVSHERIEQVLEAATRAGATGGKLSGAGRGGVVLLLSPDPEWEPGQEIADCPVLTRVTLGA